MSHLDYLVWQTGADGAGNDVLFHSSAQSPVITATTTIHRVLVVVGLDHRDVALHHPVVSVEDTHQAGDALAHAAAPRDHLHARPELVLVDPHQQDGYRVEVPGLLRPADHHVLHRPIEVVAALLTTSDSHSQLLTWITHFYLNYIWTFRHQLNLHFRPGNFPIDFFIENSYQIVPNNKFVFKYLFEKIIISQHFSKLYLNLFHELSVVWIISEKVNYLLAVHLRIIDSNNFCFLKSMN